MIGTVPGRIIITVLSEYEPDVTSLRSIVMLDDKSVAASSEPCTEVEPWY